MKPVWSIRYHEGNEHGPGNRLYRYRQYGLAYGGVAANARPWSRPHGDGSTLRKNRQHRAALAVHFRWAQSRPSSWGVEESDFLEKSHQFSHPAITALQPFLSLKLSM